MKLRIAKYGMQMILTVCFILNAMISNAQHTYFVESGQIEFEKKVNVYAKLKSRIGKNVSFWQKIYDEYRRTQPQFAISKSTLSFSKDKSVYQPVDEGKTVVGFIESDPWVMVKNNVYRDFNTDSITSIKDIYGEGYVVEGKSFDILWKMTNEVREIAGYQCKRANGLVMDSVYVVAFFSEEIIPSGGPESFSGLPGMILGLALPHENITWFATKVEVSKQVLPDVPATFPRRTKQVTLNEFEADLQGKMKGWGEYGTDALKAFML